ncbi:MAG: DUF3426 domain-containing protein [Proteobacteria bacterium]|nr:DUF3426 domain-containing protein [Pseudomonadota bacterium]
MAEESATPRFARDAVDEATQSLPVPRWAWPLLFVLFVLLLVQILVGDRVALANNPSTRPIAVTACRVLACTIPAWSDTSSLKIVDHRIHAAPDRPGVLVVEASFRNDARWPQAWPLLQLTLSDINGVPVAQGRYAAVQYLAGAHAATIGSGQTATVQLNVSDPPQKAVSFDFALLPPADDINTR